MDIICLYPADWCIVALYGKLYYFNFTGDREILEVKEVYRIELECASKMSDGDLIGGLEFAGDFDFSGEEESTGDYCYWKII